MCCSVYLLSYILDHVIAASQGIVHPKMNIMAENVLILSIGTDLDKFRITSLAQSVGAVRMRVQTSSSLIFSVCL